MEVTQTKHAAYALRLSEQRFRTLFVVAGVGMILLDDQCRMLTVNPTFCAIMGRDSAELARKSLFIFMHPDDVEVQRRAVECLLRRQMVSTVFDARYLLETGATRWVRINVSLLPAPEKAGEPYRLLAVVEDISERVAARHELEQLSREREELLEAERAALISDLLDMSRIAAGKIAIESKPVELVQFLREAVDTQRLAADSKGLALVFSSDAEIAFVLGDPIRLKQAIGNLLSNAIKFTPPHGGQIAIRLETVADFYEVAVQDSGEGIDPRLLTQIFERFRQADTTSARRHGGLGLGLAIVKQVVELHGGSVAASSPGPGRGATFLLRLPAYFAEVHSPCAGEVPPPADLAFLCRLRVLVVEDQPAMLEHLKLILEEHGAVVTTTSTAAEALDHLRATPAAVQVLISDLGIPGMDGYQLIREVRSGLRLTSAELPALALTAFARKEDRARALGHGYQAHLTKPYAVNRLIATLRSLVRL